MSEDSFSQPWEVRDLDIAFPAGALERMPAWEDIPEEYRSNSYREWPLKFWTDAFHWGIKNNVAIYPKNGIDPEKAFRHLRSIVGSFEPKHEHKMAALSYLTDKWFDSIEWERGDGPK